jgi:hypothetical protein
MNTFLSFRERERGRVGEKRKLAEVVRDTTFIFGLEGSQVVRATSFNKSKEHDQN